MLDCPSSGQTILSSIPICSIFPASFSSLGSFPLYHTEGASVRFKTDPTKWQLASFLFFFLTPRTPDEATLGAHPPHPLHQATDSAVRVTIGKWLRGDRGLMGPAVQRPQPRPSAFSAFRGRHSHLSGLGKCTFPGSPTGGNGRGPENLHFNKLPSP